jgi:oxygen-independent coproporphyrinogen III oxidase
MKPQTFASYAASAVPRYTSYPTAPVFSGEVGENHYRCWLDSLDSASSGSIYVHLPFCRSMCLYCGCHTTVTARQDPITRYCEALELEVALLRKALGHPLRIQHLHFGGGSPTLMLPEQMIRLVRVLRDSFAFAPDAEVAIEIDPRTLTGEMAEALGQSGFSRASVGVQCFDPRVQRAINRIQSYEVTEWAVSLLRQSTISRINFDLIYGLPCQTVASCLDTVEKALKLRPDRFAVFGYAHVPEFKRHQRKIDATTLPDTAARLEQSQQIAAALMEEGYIQVGLDHFARPDDPLAQAWRAGTLRRNFQGYTTDTAQVLLGLGASSIGRLPAGFVQNAVLISDYEKSIASDRLPIARGYAVSPEDRLRATIIERIMCDHRVDVEAVCQAFGAIPEQVVDRARLNTLARDGLIELSGPILAVRKEAYPLVRSVAAAFDAYLPQTQARHSRGH